MTDQLPMPSRGPAEWSDRVPLPGVEPSLQEPSPFARPLFTADGLPVLRHQAPWDVGEANRDLISAAFNAATAAADLGFDPIGAVQQLPMTMQVLGLIQGHVSAAIAQMGDKHGKLNQIGVLVDRALAAARTRKGGAE